MCPEVVKVDGWPWVVKDGRVRVDIRFNVMSIRSLGRDAVIGIHATRVAQAANQLGLQGFRVTSVADTGLGSLTLMAVFRSLPQEVASDGR